MPEIMAGKNEGNGEVGRVEETKNGEREKRENVDTICFRRCKHIEMTLCMLYFE